MSQTTRQTRTAGVDWAALITGLGLGLTILILKLLMPDVMSGFEGTLTAFFGVTETILTGVQSGLTQ